MKTRKPTCCRCDALKEVIASPYCRACNRAVKDKTRKLEFPVRREVAKMEYGFGEFALQSVWRKSSSESHN